MAEKPTTAFVISLVGGILQLLLGIAVAGRWYPMFGTESDVIFGAYLIILAVITILAALMMYNKPSSAHTWGTIIIVLSIITGLNIITLIGGVLARRWKTSEALPPPPPPPP